MNYIKKIGHNFIFLIISDVISQLLSFIFLIWLIKYLGPYEFGIYSTSTAFISIFIVFVDLGLNVYVVREMSKNVNLTNNYISNAISIKIILGIITFIMIVISANIIDYPYETIVLIYIMGLFVLINPLNDLFYSVYKAHQEMEYFAIGKILIVIIKLIGIYIIININLSLITFAYLYIISAFIVLLYNIAITKIKYTLPKPKFDFIFLKKQIKDALPFTIIIIMIRVHQHIDKIMISKMVPDANQAVGWYNVAYTLIMALYFIPTITGQVLFPILSKQKDSNDIIIKYFLKYMLILAMPIGIGTTLLAKDIILLFFNLEYINSVLPLQILVWSTVLLYIHAPFERILEAQNHQNLVAKTMILCVICNISLNFLLIPSYSYIGASISTTITELFLLLIIIYYYKNVGYNINKEILLILPRIIVVSLLMGIFIYYFSYFNLIFIILLSTIIYTFGLLLSKVINQEDIYILQTILK